ncbi:MAG: TetR/AcrR family transcriptional regulator, partial [Clostridia bacterium]|nr:TetR/AcrR family transcriptional regulator [Clostridia bacterium]
MNRTKRKIFEAAMELFAQKGYDGTSVEEITSVVGIAKGTLYYHFSSKEEIFYFLVEEGMKLLKNSIEIKTSKIENSIDKIKAIILIQIKIIVKYENLITLLISQMWGKEERNLRCREFICDYTSFIEEIIKQGIEKGEINEGNPEAIASGIFGFTCSG